MRNIDDDINRLLEIKRCILEFKKYVESSELDVIPISKFKYYELFCNNAIRCDALYYLFEPETGQYLENYIY